MKNPDGSVLRGIVSLSQIAVAQNYQLVWQEEINGSQANSSLWDIPNDGNVQHNGLEYYSNRPSNLTVSNGTLVITALKEEYSGMMIKCAELETGTNSVSPWMISNENAFSNNIGSVSFNHSWNGLHGRRWTKNSIEDTDGSKSCRLASHSRHN